MIVGDVHYVFKVGSAIKLFYYDETSQKICLFGWMLRMVQTILFESTSAALNNVTATKQAAWASIGSCSVSGNVLTGSNFLSTLKLRDIISVTGGNLPGKTVTMGSFVSGKEYIITNNDGANFTSIGASMHTEGLRFVATGSGTSGQAGEAKQVDQGAQVISIVNNTTAILDRALEDTSGTMYRSSYRPDFENDTL